MAERIASSHSRSGGDASARRACSSGPVNPTTSGLRSGSVRQRGPLADECILRRFAAIRATPRLEKVPILVVTATGGAPDWRLLSSLGADGFLVKPIDPTGLVALARRTLVSASRRSS